jgi:hypothetical protein
MKNIIIGILSIVSVGATVYGYMQKSMLDNIETTCASEKKELETQAKEFQKMAEIAQQEAVVQRTICEEQLKAFKK